MLSISTVKYSKVEEDKVVCSCFKYLSVNNFRIIQFWQKWDNIAIFLKIWFNRTISLQKLYEAY